MSIATNRNLTSLFITLVGLVTITACSEPGNNDPVERGKRIHADVCLPCHGTSLYVSPKREIKSLAALRQEVARWGDYYNPALSEQEIDDLTAYLNVTFYKF